jgi:hypothetical protein
LTAVSFGRSSIVFCALRSSETAKAVRPIGGSRAGFACAPRHRPPRLGCRPSSRRLRRHYGVGRIDVLVRHVMVVIHDALALTPGTCGKNTGAHRHASHKARDVVRRAAKEPLGQRALSRVRKTLPSFRDGLWGRARNSRTRAKPLISLVCVHGFRVRGRSLRPGMTIRQHFFRSLLSMSVIMRCARMRRRRSSWVRARR